MKKVICFIENKMQRSKNTKCLKMLHGINKDEKHFWEKRKIALKKRVKSIFVCKFLKVYFASYQATNDCCCC